MTTTKRNWIVGVPGALLIGALGSGLWDMGVKPGGQWAARTVLTAASLGSSFVKDETYREAAKGHHEVGTLFILVSIIAILISVPLEFMRRVNFPERRLSDSTTNLTSEEIDKTIKKLVKRINALSLFVLVIVGLLSIQVLQIAQASAAYTFFSQSMTICRPYVTEKESQLLSSRYAAVRNRANYIGIIEELRQIARSKQLSLPDYEPW